MTSTGRSARMGGEGLSYQEIAAHFEIPVSTCGTWLYRARQRCKQYLTQEKGGFYEKR